MEASGLLIGICDSEDWLLLGTYFLGSCTGHVTAHISMEFSNSRLSFRRHHQTGDLRLRLSFKVTAMPISISLLSVYSMLQITLK